MSTIQITDAGIALMQAASAPIVLTSYQLGSAFGYTPTSGQTTILGSVVKSGTPGSPVAQDSNNVLYATQLLASEGPYSFGEVGFFYQSTLFAIMVLDQMVHKVPQDPNDSSIGGPLVIDAFIPMVGSNYQMWANISQANTNKISVLPGPELLPTSVHAVPNAYVVQAPNGYKNFLAYTDRYGTWEYSDFDQLIETPIMQASASALSIDINAIPGLQFGIIGQYLFQVTTGQCFGATRYISAILPDHNGHLVLSANAPFAKVPIPGDLLRVYKAWSGIPLLNKGDILGFSTKPERIPVGTPGQTLIADPTSPLGVRWSNISANLSYLPYDLNFSVTGALSSGTAVGLLKLLRPVSFGVDFPGASASCLTPPGTSGSRFVLSAQGTGAIMQIDFAPGSNNGTITPLVSQVLNLTTGTLLTLTTDALVFDESVANVTIGVTGNAAIT